MARAAVNSSTRFCPTARKSVARAPRRSANPLAELGLARGDSTNVESPLLFQLCLSFASPLFYTSWQWARVSDVESQNIDWEMFDELQSAQPCSTRNRGLGRTSTSASFLCHVRSVEIGDTEGQGQRTRMEQPAR